MCKWSLAFMEKSGTSYFCPARPAFAFLLPISHHGLALLALIHFETPLCLTKYPWMQWIARFICKEGNALVSQGLISARRRACMPFHLEASLIYSGIQKLWIWGMLEGRGQNFWRSLSLFSSHIITDSSLRNPLAFLRWSSLSCDPRTVTYRARSEAGKSCFAILFLRVNISFRESDLF